MADAKPSPKLRASTLKPTTKTPWNCSVMHSGAHGTDFYSALGPVLQVIEFKRINLFDFW
jgi:hypothetical protein